MESKEGEGPEVQEQPCGCALYTYPDGRQEYDPCVPCAFRRAGEMLMAVSNKMARMAERAERASKKLVRAKPITCPHGQSVFTCPQCNSKPLM